MKSNARTATVALAVMFTVLFTAMQIARAQMNGNAQSDVHQTIQSDVITLQGHVPKWVSTSEDLGPVDGLEQVRHLTLNFSRSPERESAFQHLLLAQQIPYDPLYHYWYSSSELGKEFGASDAQVLVATSWLEGNGLRVMSVSNSKTFIEFSGSIAALSSAFGVTFHRFRDSGEDRWSITSEPKIPNLMAQFVRHISGLSTERAYTTLEHGTPVPELTSCSAGNCAHYITPNDFATIYNVAPAYAKNINGSGQAIAVIGEAAIDPVDVTSFNSVTGVNVPQPTVIVPPNGTNPGAPITTPQNPECTPTTDTPICNLLSLQGEATLDVERAGSVAPGASLKLIVSSDTKGDPGILVATQFAIDSAANEVPDIVTISFYNCESSSRTALENSWNDLFEQGAAEGISIFVSSGDSDATCFEPKFSPPTEEDQFLSVNLYCASSVVTCVGGTEFNDTGATQYWSKSNGTGLESALSYIPEGAWNDPVQHSGEITVYDVEGSGGGFSQYLPSPPWQSNIRGFPAQLGRALPDLAFSSSCHDGYLVCMESDGNGHNCALNDSGVPHGGNFCGTSAATPSMAGIMALVDQANGGKQGNTNPELYTLASTASNLVFNDTTIASSGVTGCDIDTASLCNNSSPSIGGLTGGTLGYPLRSGFDEVTGWGSINVQHLIDDWLPAPSVVANPGTISISLPGSAGGSTLSILGFPTANVTLSCKNLPRATECSFGEIALNNTVTLNIATNFAATTDNSPLSRGIPKSFCVLFLFLLGSSSRLHKCFLGSGRWHVLLVVLTLFGFGSFMGCSTRPTTPKGTTAITVTATEGAISASTQIQLIVQ